MKKHLVLGILAHVDAGKTTLSEAILYTTGTIRKFGRVDNHDAFLDNYALERARGITIFSKQAVFDLGDMTVTLLDTPGHADFSAETERTLKVLDYAVLVINGADGVQEHTLVLWDLLKRYHIPCFLFVNKMDQVAADRSSLLCDIKDDLSEYCIAFDAEGISDLDRWYEEIALCDESVMEKYIDDGTIDDETIRRLIKARKIFPCYFGSALKLTGVGAFLDGIEKYASGMAECPDESFGATVYKISRDKMGSRLTHLKVTSGVLKVKDSLDTGRRMEKADQIRIYSGAKYELVNEAQAGTICAVTGLADTYASQTLGSEQGKALPDIEKTEDETREETHLNYRIILSPGSDVHAMIEDLRQFDEEQPELNVTWNEAKGELQVHISGDVQRDVIKYLVKERFGTDIELSGIEEEDFGGEEEFQEEPFDALIEESYEEYEDMPSGKERSSGQHDTSKAGSKKKTEEEELEEIFNRTYGPRKEVGPKTGSARNISFDKKHSKKEEEPAQEYLLVDGYNIIFAWDELNELAKTSIESARQRLMDILSNYQGYKNCTLILVFDAYKVEGNLGEMFRYHNIYVVYTKEAQKADQYIEKQAHDLVSRYHVTVATSDGQVQLIIRGDGCMLLSARDLLEDVKAADKEIRMQYIEPLNAQRGGDYVFGRADDELSEYLEYMRLGKGMKDDGRKTDTE